MMDIYFVLFHTESVKNVEKKQTVEVINNVFPISDQRKIDFQFSVYISNESELPQLMANTATMSVCVDENTMRCGWLIKRWNNGNEIHTHTHNKKDINKQL